MSGVRNWLYGAAVGVNYDGSIAVVGAPGYESSSSPSGYGTAYLQVRPSSGWPSGSYGTGVTYPYYYGDHVSGIQFTSGTNWNQMNGLYLGKSISMDQYGDTIIIGAPYQNEFYPQPTVSGEPPGPRVCIYAKPSGGWGSLYQYGSTKAPDGIIQASDLDTNFTAYASQGYNGYAKSKEFGLNIDMAKDGSAIVVGSPGDDDGGNYSGSVYLYTKPSSGWNQGSTIITTHAAKLLPTSRHSANDEFGVSCSISNYLTSGTHANKYVILGGSHKDDIGSTDTGTAWFFMGVPAIPQTLNFSSGLTVSGDITASGTIAATSDERLKDDIEKIQNALDKIELLNGYTYTMKDTRTRRYTGLIAQEVLSVLPEVVCGSEDTNYALAYGNMMGLIVEAIKEMREQIKNIETQL